MAKARTTIGIPEKNLQKIALELNKALADEFVLYTKTRNYHWNVTGSNFMEMHKFYEGQYEQLDTVIDDMAERIRAIGHHAEARLSDYIELTNLVEQQYTDDQNKQLGILLDDHETIIRNLRRLTGEFTDKLGDVGTADFVTGVMEMHEKMAWMIRSYLQ